MPDRGAEVTRLALFILAISGLLLASAWRAPAAEPESLGPAASAGNRGRADALLGEGLKLYQSQDYVGGRDRLEQALAIYRRLGLERETANTLHNIGWRACELADYPTAQRCFEEELAIYRKLELQDTAEVADVLHGLGWAAKGLGQYDQAVTHLKQGVAIAEKVGDARCLWGIARMLAWALEDKGDYDSAQVRHEEALAAAERGGMVREAADELRNLADLTGRAGRSDRAVGYREQALAIYRKLGMGEAEVQVLSDIGSGLCRKGDFAAARPWLAQALTLARNLGLEEPAARALESMAWAARGLSRCDEAIRCDEESLAISRKVGSENGMATALQGLGWTMIMLGRSKEAFGYFEEAVALYRRVGPYTMLAGTLTGLGRAASNLGKHDAAAKACEEALAIARKLGLKREEADALKGLARAATSLSKVGEAAGQYEQAAAIYRKLGARREAVSTLEEAAVALGQKAYREQALAVCREPAPGKERAELLHHLGGLLCCHSDGQRAYQCFEEELANYRQLGGREEAGVAYALWALGAASHELSHFDRALDYLQQSLEMFGRLGDERGQVLALIELGTTHDHLGEYDTSASLLRDALAICRKIGDAKMAGKALERLAENADYRQQPQQIVDYLDEALAAYREAGDVGGQIRALENLGAFAGEVGQIDKAIRSAEESLSLTRGAPYDEPCNLGNLAWLAWQCGEYEKAEAYFAEAVALGTGPQSSILADAAALEKALGHYDKAAEYLKNALAIFGEPEVYQPTASPAVAGPSARCDKADWATTHGHSSHAEGLKVSAELAVSLADYQRAAGYAERVLPLYRWLESVRGEAAVLDTLAEISMEASQYEKADGYLNQALAKDPTRTHVRLMLAELRMRQGRLAEAKTALDQASTPPGAGTGHLEPRELAPSRDILWGRYYLVTGRPEQALERFANSLPAAGRDMGLLVAGHIGSGLAQEAGGRWRQAADAFSQAVALIEQSRAQTRPEDRTRFFEGRAVCFRRLEAYEGLVRVFHRMGEDEDSFYWSEHTKARVLTEALAQAPYGAPLGLPAELRKEEDNLTSRIAALSQLAEAKPAARAELERQLAGLRARQAALIARLRRDYPEYASMRYPSPLHADELALEPAEVLLAFEVTESESFVFVVHGGKVARVFEIRLSRQKLADLVRKFRSNIAEVHRAGDLKAMDLETSQRLYQLLLEPALAKVTPRERVTIVPDEVIGLLPLETLVISKTEGAHWTESAHGPCPVGVHYVGDTRVFTYWQSATAMTTARRLRKEAPGSRALAVAGPVPGTDRAGSGAVALAGVSDDPAGVSPTSRSETARWQPVGAQTVGALRALYGPRLTALVGPEAREGLLKREPLAEYGTMVFATHGVLDGGAPGVHQPALVLSQVGNDPGEDGYLTMAEVMDLKLRADVVALMACESGAGEIAGGEGVMALGRAFQYAGARSVLASLWKAEDESAALLTQVFLQQMAAGRGKAEALLAARRALREAGYEHPFYWAAFVLIGEDGPAQSPRP